MPAIPLDTLLRRFRSPTHDEIEALRRYRERAGALADRARAIRVAWVEVAQVATERERQANAASVNRWELLRLGEQLEQVTPPRTTAGAHRDLLAAFADQARAYQLLATGYRFHKSEALCDGQALLLESSEMLDTADRRIEARSARR